MANRAMFEVKADKSQREMVYDLFSGAEVGRIFSIGEISAALGFDITNSRGPVYQGIALLQERDHRTALNVRGEGYRIAAANEHVMLARERRTRAARQIRRGVRTLQGTRLAELTPSELAVHEQQAIRLDAHERQLRAHDKRLHVLEAAQQGLSVRVDREEARSSGTDERLARLERELRVLREEREANEVGLGADS